MTVALLTLMGVAIAGDATPAGDAAPAGDAQPADAPAPAGEAPPAGDDDAARDALFFGAAPPPSPGPSAEPSSLGADAALEEGTRSDAAIDSLLDERDASLTIGGRMYLRGNVSVPDVEEVTPEQAVIDSPNFLDLFVDARPNDRVRAYAGARLYHDPAVRTGDTTAFGTDAVQSRVVLDQLYLKFDVARRVYVTAGRQRVKWGTGRFWNPTDVLNPARLDALAFFDERTGVNLVKLHFPVESAGLNLYAVADLEGVNRLWEARTEVETELDLTGTSTDPRVDGPGGALRAEWAVGPGEISATVAGGPDRPLKLGADASFGVWVLDLRLEGAVSHGGDARRWEGELDWESFTFPTATDVSDEWIPQVGGGVEIAIRLNDEDSMSVGAEYFYNGAGYADASLYPWLALSGDFVGFYVGQHYAAGYAFVAGPGQWDEATFTASYLANLSDQTSVARLDVSNTFLTWLAINAFAQVPLGEDGEFHFGLEVPAIPGVFEEGLTVTPTAASFGLGASVRF